MDPTSPPPAATPGEDLGDLFGGFDLEPDAPKARPKREWTGTKKVQHVKPPVRAGVHPNKPEMAQPSGLFAEFMDPKPEYYEEGGLRRVRPYQYAFHSWVKERWQGRTVLDVYGEFRDRSLAYYEWATEMGLIRVNNVNTTIDTVLVDGDLISNLVHRHEPPVRAGPVRIIYDGRLPGNDGKTLVVEKPGSMPVHSTGRYHFNTLLSILKYDYDLPLVHTSNRLDRLTSGVMICALTVEGSKELGAWFGGQRLKDGGVKKEYVARCLGKFPDGEVLVDEPLLTIDRQLGVNVVHPDGRESQTIFKRLSYHEATNTSVVNCKPITGRSHQIRVHLQYIGHPIANDPVYQNQAAWGTNGGKGGVFGTDRGGTEQTRQLRREMGEKLRAAHEEGASSSLPSSSSLSSDDPSSDPDTTTTTTTTTTTSNGAIPDQQGVTFNKRGAIRVGLLSPEAQAAAIAKANENDDGREAHDAPLTPEARAALAELRIIKDASDGWARERDEHALEMGRRAARKAKGEEVEEEELRDPTMEGPDGGLGFCETCFTPEIADPRPDQLFIWLHALRYTTSDWDWCSELPYWALEGWNGE